LCKKKKVRGKISDQLEEPWKNWGQVGGRPQDENTDLILTWVKGKRVFVIV